MDLQSVVRPFLTRMYFLYKSVFEIVNIPLQPVNYLQASCLFFCTYISIYLLLNLLSDQFRACSQDKQIYVVIQCVKFSNKIVICIITGGCALFLDYRLLNVQNWNLYRDVFYNLAFLFSWSDFVGLLLTRRSMTTLCQLHHLGVVVAYIYVYQSSHLGDGLFRACIMYGVFAATAFAHNLHSVIKNVVILSQEAERLFSRIDHLGMLLSNVVNWGFQIGYVFIYLPFFCHDQVTSPVVLLDLTPLTRWLCPWWSSTQVSWWSS